MKDEKFEGIVRISSAEYRELITEAVEATKNYEVARSENWQKESKISALKKELEEAQKELEMVRNQLASYLASSSQTNIWAQMNSNSSAIREA